MRVTFDRGVTTTLIYIERIVTVLTKKEKISEVIFSKRKLVIYRKQLRLSGGKRSNGSLVWFHLHVLKT